MLQYNFKFAEITRCGTEEDVIRVEVCVGGEFGGFKVESSERGAAVEIAEENRVENGRKGLVPFSSDV